MGRRTEWAFIAFLTGWGGAQKSIKEAKDRSKIAQEVERGGSIKASFLFLGDE